MQEPEHQGGTLWQGFTPVLGGLEPEGNVLDRPNNEALWQGVVRVAEVAVVAMMIASRSVPTAAGSLRGEVPTQESATEVVTERSDLGSDAQGEQVFRAVGARRTGEPVTPPSESEYEADEEESESDDDMPALVPDSSSEEEEEDPSSGEGSQERQVRDWRRAVDDACVREGYLPLPCMPRGYLRHDPLVPGRSLEACGGD